MDGADLGQFTTSSLERAENVLYDLLDYGDLSYTEKVAVETTIEVITSIKLQIEEG